MNDHRHILVFYKKDFYEAKKTALDVAAWLEAKNISSSVLEAGEEIPDKQFECAIVAGGDGTILGIARKLAFAKVPILGINFGKVGFLTVASKENWQETVCDALCGHLAIKQYLALEWQVKRQSELFASGIAANDVVISRGFPARLLSARVKIDNEDCGLLRSDGIIISTPLGSSGYSISAGGPLVYPAMNAICLTAICPFPMGIAPLVFPGNARVEMEIEPYSGECFITIDGQSGLKLKKHDHILMSGRENALTFYVKEKQFFRHLRKRGFALE